MLKAAIGSNNYSKAWDLIEKLTSFRPYCENRRYKLDIDFVGASTYMVTGQHTKAFEMVRFAMLRSDKDRLLHSSAFWNFFTRIVNSIPDRKSHKYILRMLFKQPLMLPLIICNGHNAFLCGSYRYAIGKLADVIS